MNRGGGADASKKNEQLILDLLKIDSNKYCADCGQKGTRWASWNIGVFLCIRCGGLHRALGTHISKVKSVTLDTWTDEQLESIRGKGNAKVNMVYNPHPDRHPFPTFSDDMENYIRDKYERKLFMSEGGSASGHGGPLSLKSRQGNLLDFEEFDGPSRGNFKSAAPTNLVEEHSQYGKQLNLLTEMGFVDCEFNLKALRAANGNMQEALEIIVATNQKQRRKSSVSAASTSTEKANIFDEFDRFQGSPPSSHQWNTATPKLPEPDQSQFPRQQPSMNSINISAWGEDEAFSSKQEDMFDLPKFEEKEQAEAEEEKSIDLDSFRYEPSTGLKNNPSASNSFYENPW